MATRKGKLGISMPAARAANGAVILATDGKLRINREAALQEYGVLSCLGAECNASVLYVKEHERLGQRVEPIFRLAMGSRHGDFCGFVAAEMLTIIARKAKSDVFEALGNSAFRFRINILYEPLKALATKSGIGAIGPVVAGKRKRYKAGGKLAAYLKTVGQILEIYLGLFEHESLLNLVEFNLNGRVIHWQELFYATEDYRRCYEYIDHSERSGHPVCLMGRVREFEEIYPNYHVIELEHHWVEQPDSDGWLYIPSPRVVVRHPDLVRQLIKKGVKTGAQVAVFSDFRTELRTGENNRKYLNIKGGLYHTGQIVILS